MLQVNQAAIVENKHFDAALLMARLMQEQLPARRRNLNEQCHRSQGPNLFPSPAPPNQQPAKRKTGTSAPSPSDGDYSRTGDARAGVREPAAKAADPGANLASSAHRQGLRCTSSKNSAQELRPRPASCRAPLGHGPTRLDAAVAPHGSTA